MNQPRSNLRKFRFPLLILLIIVVGFTLAGYHGGLILLSADSYPQTRQMPQMDNITAQVLIRSNVESKTIIPGLLYYYRLTPSNTLEILLEAPVQRDYAVQTGGILSCELKYGDERSVTLVPPSDPVTAVSTNGDSVAFTFEIPDLQAGNLTLTCKTYLEGDGKKIMGSVFKKIMYTSKREFYLRSMIDKKGFAAL
jgi:hypothetical protein